MTKLNDELKKVIKELEFLDQKETNRFKREIIYSNDRILLLALATKSVLELCENCKVQVVLTCVDETKWTKMVLSFHSKIPRCHIEKKEFEDYQLRNLAKSTQYLSEREVYVGESRFDFDKKFSKEDVLIYIDYAGNINNFIELDRYPQERQLIFAGKDIALYNQRGHYYTFSNKNLEYRNYTDELSFFDNEVKIKLDDDYIKYCK
jgi:hypothetical protein